MLAVEVAELLCDGLSELSLLCVLMSLLVAPPPPVPSRSNVPNVSVAQSPSSAAGEYSALNLLYVYFISLY